MTSWSGPQLRKLAAVLLLLVPVALAVFRGDGRHRFLALLGAGYGGLVILVVLIANWSPALQVQQPSVVMAAQRYSAAPCLFLLTAAALDSISPAGTGSRCWRHASSWPASWW